MSGLITAAVAVYAWRVVRVASALLLIGLVSVLAGALGNLVDRAGDGLVTDYLHTGWWPTFNVADVLITLGAITVALAALREDTSACDGERVDKPVTAPGT
ncbi:signal peptidase II [Modestobacter muralis]|uniref:signal peptidase II n=1 Tax=Modestobacter muralis TaxID=1608614 RepID=UPI001B8AA994